MRQPIPALLLAYASLAFGHWTFDRTIVNDINSTESDIFEYVRRHQNGYNPMEFEGENFTSLSLRCNEGASSADTTILSVNAGDKIRFLLDQDYLGTQNYINHPGPHFVYMSKAPDGGLAAYDGSGDWFKVWEAGPCFGPNPNLEFDWCMENKTSLEFTIPKNLPAGEYLARPESIALQHAFAHRVQIYTSCAQLRVSSNGTGTPGPLVKIPGLYSANDSGMTFDIRTPYQTTTFIMPGPKLWEG